MFLITKTSYDNLTRNFHTTVDCYLAMRVLTYWYNSSQKLCPLATLLFILVYYL